MESQPFVHQHLKVCFYVFFPAGGISRYTHHLLRAMSNVEALEVEAIGSPDYQWKDAPEYSTWTGLESLSHDVALLRRFRFLKGQFVNPIRCIDHAVETGADIIHFSNINHLSFPFWKKRLETAHVPVAVTVHDVKREKRIINRSWEKQQLKAFYRFADALFVHSKYQANELIDYAGISPHKIHIVPHGPYSHGPPTADQRTIRTRLGLPQDQQIALFFGQIRDEKNLDGLIRALRLSRASPHLVVAGQAGGRHRNIKYYRRLAEQLGVENQITFIPKYIDEKEVGDLFTMADWIALPYRDSFTSQSGVLNVAAHYDRPVLVSSSPVLKETVEACNIGVACAGDTAESLAAGIDELCQRLQNGTPHQFDTYRSLYSWEENAKRALDVYSALLNI